MSQSFTNRKMVVTGPEASDPAGLRRLVLVTGAAGRIGSAFAEHAHQRYDLRLMIQSEVQRTDRLAGWGEVAVADLANLERLKALCEGIDTVVHLAANADPSAVWEDLLRDNIVGTYNMMAAAKGAGCRRLIFASSIHAVSGYPHRSQVKTSEPVNPGDVYGVSKCFGESLGRYMAEQEGLSVIRRQIGGYNPVESLHTPGGIANFDAFISERDLHQLIDRCIDDESLQWAVFHGLSGNRFSRLDIADARELVGYEPADDSSREVPGLKNLNLAEAVSTYSLADPGQKSGLRGDI